MNEFDAYAYIYDIQWAGPLENAFAQGIVKDRAVVQRVE